MHGKQVVAYVDAQLEPQFKTPVQPSKVVKSWAATQKQAEEERRRLEREYDDAIVQIE